LNFKVGMIEIALQSYTWFLLRQKFRKPWFSNWGSWHVTSLKISRDEWSKQRLTSATSATVTSWPLTSFHICYSALCLARHREKIRQLTLISSSRQSPLLVLRRDINKQEGVSYRTPALAPFIYARDSFSSVKALGLSTMNVYWKTLFRQTFLSNSFSEISSIIAEGDIVYWITCVRRQALHLKCHFDVLTSTVDRVLCIATCCLRYGCVYFLSI
jgi:hypothetical protein